MVKLCLSHMVRKAVKIINSQQSQNKAGLKCLRVLCMDGYCLTMAIAASRNVGMTVQWELL